MSKNKITYAPETPGGTTLMHLESNTEEEAWNKLLYDARHMPYNGKAGFINRGYVVVQLVPHDPKRDEVSTLLL